MYTHNSITRVKNQSLKLAYLYYLRSIELDSARFESKAWRVKQCSTFWHGMMDVRNGEFSHLQAYGCKDRMCPMCAMRKSRAIAAQAMAILPGILAAAPERVAVLVTLTIKNVPFDELEGAIDALLEAWTSMRMRRIVRDHTPAWARTIEVTRNMDTGEWHPHVHIIAVVDDPLLLKPARWQSAWKAAAGLAYTPIIDARKVTSKKGVYEISKYISKLGVLLDLPLGEAYDSVLKLLEAVDGRNLRAFGGEWLKARRKANMVDVDVMDDGQLDATAAALDGDVNRPSLVPVVLWWSGLEYVVQVQPDSAVKGGPQAVAERS